MNYKDTIKLPKESISMRRSKDIDNKIINDMHSFSHMRQLSDISNGRESFILHDGPPYANGHIHMGTAMNKILKDIINRSHHVIGYDSNYIAGWDCHGLPIEWKVEEKMRSSGSFEGCSDSEFRKKCREYASEWVDIQKSEFKSLGVLSKWDYPYLTMDYKSEAKICETLLKVSKLGKVYRSNKPVMWSPVEKTSLAEAEVEYKDVNNTSIYVKFPISNGKHKGCSVLIWTTTPWTIPANRAIGFSQDIKYGVYEISSLSPSDFDPWLQVGEKIVVADNLWGQVKKRLPYR